VTTVVWKAEFAQSYIIQPKISRGSLGAAVDIARIITRPDRLEGPAAQPGNVML
jgi:hypothetical protein